VQWTSRSSWLLCLAGIIAAGILSRVIHTGLPIFDKYLGDALYAAMVYAILRLFSHGTMVAVWAMLIMIAIELFQLTLIPAHLLASPHVAMRITARLMGTEFSLWDIFTYGVGILGIYGVDSSRRSKLL
jgi:hypothetical protein